MTNPADELRTAAYKTRTWDALPDHLRQPLAEWLETTYVSLTANTHPGWQEAVAPDALAINGEQP